MLIIKRCGDFRPFNLEHTGKIFMITFLSDKIHNARGFKLSWRGIYDFQYKKNKTLLSLNRYFVDEIILSIDTNLSIHSRHINSYYNNYSTTKDNNDKDNNKDDNNNN